MNSSTRRSLSLTWFVIIICAYIQFNTCLKQHILWKKDDTHSQKVCTASHDGVLDTTTVPSSTLCSSLCWKTGSCKAFMFFGKTRTPNCYLMSAIPKGANGCGPLNGAVKKQFVLVELTFVCPTTDDYTTILLSDNNTLTYRVVETPVLTVEEAKVECDLTGGTLVKVSTPARLELIQQVVACQAYRTTIFWVDGSNANATDYADLNAWKFSDAKKMDTTDTFWKSGELTNVTTERCAAIDDQTSKLFHDDCSQMHAYICGKA